MASNFQKVLYEGYKMSVFNFCQFVILEFYHMYFVWGHLITLRVFNHMPLVCNCSTLETAPLVKGGLLSGQYPQKVDGKELMILVQPESQHRARYLTEGSRGSVKDRTQQSFPQVKVHN